MIEIEPEELPTCDSRDYIIEAAPESDSKSNSAGMVIFVIDTSGSMCVTTEVPGKFKLKGNKSGFDVPQMDGRPVRQRQSKNTWVSRLQCVQASIDHQLEIWSKDVGDKKVGLVTFGEEVTIIGDGSEEAVVIAGDKLGNQNMLQEIGRKHPIQKSIKDTGKGLSKKLWGLEEQGRTALGPALLVALAMAGNAPGAKVVLCTDGLANIGLGALDGVTDEDEREKIEDWYEGVGNLAKIQGVTVDVISIKGTECALEDLGNVVECSGGEVSQVNPLELTKNFASILANPVVASQVTCTFFLHEGLSFRYEEDVDGSKVTRELGNVTADTEITFEYEFDRKKLKKYKGLKALPFQVQIHFTKLDGMKCLRVISKSQPITMDRGIAEQDVRMDMLCANAVQKSAKLAELGYYGESRKVNLRHGKVMARCAKSKKQRAIFSHWMGEMNEYDGQLQQSKEEVDSVMSSRNMEKESYHMRSKGGFGMSNSSKSKKKKSGRRKVAHRLRSDGQYSKMQQYKSKSSRAYDLFD